MAWQILNLFPDKMVIIFTKIIFNNRSQLLTDGHLYLLWRQIFNFIPDEIGVVHRCSKLLALFKALLDFYLIDLLLIGDLPIISRLWLVQYWIQIWRNMVVKLLFILELRLVYLVHIFLGKIWFECRALVFHLSVRSMVSPNFILNLGLDSIEVLWLRDSLVLYRVEVVSKLLPERV